MKKSAIVAVLAPLALALASLPVQAQDKVSGDTVKLGLIEDMSSLYADITGIGAVTAAKMAV